MGIPEVLVPSYPGITSAMGLLTTDLRYDEIRNEFMLNLTVDLAKLNADLTALEHIVRQQLLADGVPEVDISIERGADCRYVGQGYELRTRIPPGHVTADNIDVIWDNFHQIHKEEYGHHFLENPIELVSLRVAGVGRMPKLRLPSIEAGGHDGSEGYLRNAEVYFRIDGKLGRRFAVA